MKKNILPAILLSFFTFFYSHAQTTGDFQSKNSVGNWSDFNTWNIYNGALWIAASAGQLPSPTSAVYIQNGHTVTVDNAMAICNDLYVSAGGSTGRLAFAATGILNIKGIITVNNSASNYFSPWITGGRLIFSGSGNQFINGLTAATVLADVEINKPSGFFTTTSNFRFGNITLTAGDFVVGSGNEIQGSSSSSAITVNGGTWTQVGGTTRINVAGTAGSPIGPVQINGGVMTLATSTGTGGFNFSSLSVTNNGILNLNNFTGSISIANSLSIDASSTLNNALVNFLLPPSVNFSGLVNYNHTGVQTIPSSTYKHLKLSGSGTKTLGTGITYIPDSGILEMSGAVSSPTLALGGNTLSVSNVATTLVYSSAVAQTASAAEWNAGFRNVTINNAAGVSMAGLVRTITGTLSLLTGTLNIGPAGSLTLDGASLVSTSGFLSGTNTSDFSVLGTEGGIVVIPQSGNISFRNMAIGGTRKVVMNGVNSINLSGVFSVGSTATFDNGGESQIIQNAGGSIIIDGRFITKDAEGFTGTNAAIPGIIPVLNTGCIIEYGRLGNQIFNARSDYKNLVFSGSGNKTLSSGCIPAGTVFITGNAVLETLNFTFGDITTNLSMDGGRFRLAGTGTKPDIEGNYHLTGGVIEFFGGTSATFQRIRSAANIYYHTVEVNSPYVANSNTNINLGSGGSFVIKSGASFTINDEAITGPNGTQTVTLESGSRFVCGDMHGFSGGTGASTTSIRADVENINLADGSTVEYSRATVQVLSARTDYKNVVINGGGEKIVNGAVTINGILTLTNGIVTSTLSNLLTLSATASCPAGGNTGSFINGPMIKVGNTAFAFPVGKPEVSGSAGGGFRLISISAPAQVTDAFMAEFIVGSASALGPISSAAGAAGLARVSRCEYWKLDRITGHSSVNVTLSWNARSNCNVSYVTSLPDVAIAAFNEVAKVWDTFGVDSWSGDVTTGTVTWNNVSSFSTFSLASTDFLENLLPLSILDLNGRAGSTDILVSWRTNKQDVGVFELEKSINGFSFERFKQVDAKTDSFSILYSVVDKQPFSGWNYYRLRAIDKLGKQQLSQIIKVWFGYEQQIKIGPNPAGDKIFIIFSQPGSISEINIVNISGQVLKRISAIQFNNEINISHLQAGMYYVRVIGKNGLTTTSFVKQ